MSADYDDLAEAQRLLNAMVAQRRAAGVRGDPVVQVAELRAEVAQLRAIIDGRPTAPTDAELAAHKGPWLVLFSDDGIAVEAA